MVRSLKSALHTPSAGGGSRGRSSVPFATEPTPIRVLIVAVVAAALFAGLFAGGVVADDADASAESNLSVSADLAEPYDGEEVTFETEDNDDVEHYEWSFGDGTTLNATEQTVEHTYDAAGDYTVELTAVGEDGETDTATTTVAVEESLEAAVDIDQSSPEQGAPVTLLASASTGEVAEYRWNVSGRQVTTLRPRMQHSFAQDGNQTVELTVASEDGDTDTTVQTVAVERAGLKASLNASETELIVEQPVQFLSDDSTGPIEERHWDVDDDGNATVRNAWAWWTTHRYAESGNYTATITVVGANGENDTATANVSVAAENDSAVLDADVVANDTSPAVGETVSFDAMGTVGNVSSYWWHTDGYWQDWQSTNTYTFVEAGQYNVTLVAVGEDATEEAHVEIEVQPEVEPNAMLAVEPATADEGDTVTFDANGTAGAITTYRWTFGDGTTAVTNDSVVEHEYGSAGTYEASVTAVDAVGQNDTANATVTVDSAEELMADVTRTDDSTIAGKKASFHALESTGHNGTFRWQFGDGTTEYTTAAATGHTYTAVGNYTVELTVFAPSGATDTATLNLTVDPYELGDALDHEYEEPLVVGEPAGFGVASPGYLPNSTQHWNFGDGTTYETGGFPPVYHAYDEPGTYAVEGQIRSDGDLAARTTENVTVVEQNESAQIEAAIDVSNETPTNRSYVQFDANASTGDLTGYWWDLETRDWLHEGQTVRERFEEPGTYNVTLTVVGENATNATTVQVEVTAESSDDADSGGDDSNDGDDGSPGGIPAPSPGPSPSEEATVEIAGVDAPSTVAPGAEVDVTVDVENSGDADGTADVGVDLEGGSDASVERSLDAGASGQVDVTLTAPESAGIYELSVETEDDGVTESVAVEDDSSDGSGDEEQPDEDGADDSDGTDGDGGDADGTPGFGIAAALVALAIGLLARRRSQA